MNKVVNIHVQVFVWTHVSTPLGKYQGARLSSEVAISFWIPTDNGWEFLLLYILTSFGGSVLDFGHFNSCIVVSHCFNLQFPNDMMLNIFSCVFLPSVDFLWRGICLGLLLIFFLLFFSSSFIPPYSLTPPTPQTAQSPHCCPCPWVLSLFFFSFLLNYSAYYLIGLFVSLLLSFKSSLCTWDNSSVSDLCFANIFSQSVASHSLHIVLHRAQVFNFNEVQLTYYFFHGCAFGVGS